MITSVMLARQIILPRPLPAKLTPLRPYSCRLFVAPQKINSFGIKQMQTLFAKHPGWGVPLAACLGVLCLAPLRSITPFRINTCKSVTKQTTLTTSRINTYAKTGGRGTPGLSQTFRHFPNQEFLCSSVPRWPNLPRSSDVTTFRPSARFQLGCL